MKRLVIALLGLLIICAMTPALAGSGNIPTTHGAAMHRYLIKRSFPAGALDGLDQTAKNKVNVTNAKFHVKWIQSYATADKNTTFCVYEAPNVQAIRDAAKANSLPVDQVFEVPVTLLPNSKDLANQ